MMFGRRLKFSRAGWGILAFLFCASLYLLRLDAAAGALVDDGWYILLGKALATGQGYTLINSPSSGIMPFYPPAFPALLSLIFRLAPSFPANVWILKLPSILSLLLSGGLIYYYLVHIHEVSQETAFGIALLTLLTPALVFLATSTLMSEIFFTLIQTATLVSVERSLKVADKRVSWLLVMAGACLASIAFLTRSISIGLLLAAGIYFLLNRRVLYALAFSLIVCVIVGPWLGYTKHHAPTPAQIFEQQGYITQSYATQFWQKAAGDADSGTITYRGLPKRVFIALSEVCTQDIGGLALPALYRGSAESGLEVLNIAGDMGLVNANKIISSILSGFCLLGFVAVLRRKLTLSELTILCTLPIILSWPWPTFRFILPFTPLIFLYLVSGINYVWRALSRWLAGGEITARWNDERRLTAPVRIFLMIAILLNVYDHTNYVLGKFRLAGAPPWLAESVNESEELMEWMRTDLEPSAIIATDNPPLVYLYTGLKTVNLSNLATRKEEMARRNVDYIVYISPYFASPLSETDVRNRTLYHTNHFRFFVLKLK